MLTVERPSSLRNPTMVEGNFAARLRELREGRGWTRADLAERAGVPVANVTQWEQGRFEPSWANVQALADALGVTTEAFREAPSVPPSPAKRGRPRKGRTEKPPEESG